MVRVACHTVLDGMAILSFTERCPTPQSNLQLLYANTWLKQASTHNSGSKLFNVTPPCVCMCVCVCVCVCMCVCVCVCVCARVSWLLRDLRH